MIDFLEMIHSKVGSTKFHAEEKVRSLGEFSSPTIGKGESGT